MKLTDLIFRPVPRVAFGQAMSGGGLTSVDLVANPTASSVILTASDGSAAPIAGADGSTAGVMTAADKAKLDGLELANTRDFASAADVAAASMGAEATHLRTTGRSSAGDRGGALYKRIASQPAHGLALQSADGAWWELVPEHGVVSFAACGGIQGNSAANGAANVAAFDAFIGFAQAWDNGQPSFAAALTLLVPRGIWHFNAHLNVKATCHIVGESGWNDSGKGGAWLKFAADTDGLIFHDNDTIDATVTALGKSAVGSTISRLTITGPGASVGSTGNGIWMRTSITIRDCLIADFRENGIKVLATSGGGGATEGNANLWKIENTKVTSNHLSGLYVDGNDVNAGVCTGLDAALNGRWGIHDSSFLGNTYVGCHASTNGLATGGGNPAGMSSFVSFGGNRYAAHAEASEASLVATTPGTDTSKWIPMGVGGSSSSVPLWTAAQPAGTYFAGGPYRGDNVNAHNVFIGCYRENDQGPLQIVSPGQIYGGLVDINKGGGLQFNNRKLVGAIDFPNSETNWAASPARALTYSVNPQASVYWRTTAAGDSAAGLALQWYEPTLSYAFMHANLIARRYLQFTSDLVPAGNFGRSTAVGGGWPVFTLGFMLGDTAGSHWNARRMCNSNAAPSSGEWGRGDIVWNRDAAAGAVLGWVCTAGGTPGTWVEIRGVANQTSGANQTAITNSTGGTRDGTLAAVGNTSAQNQAAVINDNFTDLHTLLNEVRSTLVGAGLMKGSA